MTQSKPYDQALQAVRKAFGPGIEPSLVSLAAALACCSFRIDQIGDLRDGKPWLQNRGYGPYIWIWSIEGQEILQESWELDENDGDSPTHAELRDKKTVANLRDRERLLNLLGEFYSKRFASIHVRLIISDMAVGSSMLKSQGSDVMALPELEPEREKWLQDSQKEMADFADFLIKRNGLYT